MKDAIIGRQKTIEIEQASNGSININGKEQEEIEIGLEKVLIHIASELNFCFPDIHAYVSKSSELPQLIIHKKLKQISDEKCHK